MGGNLKRSLGVLGCGLSITVRFALASALRFFGICIATATKKGWLLIGLNWLFFGGILVGAIVTEYGVMGLRETPLGSRFPLLEQSVLLVFISVFVYNLAIASFVALTLSGVLFCGFPLVFLFLRALSWGALALQCSLQVLLTALPTLILEGEAYVLASIAGVYLGPSWIRPSLVYREENLSRSESFRRAWVDCFRVYVLVVMLLGAAAVIEALTLYSMGEV